MKKIFYLLFFISLCFVVNYEVKAENSTARCVYEGAFQDEDIVVNLSYNPVDKTGTVSVDWVNNRYSPSINKADNLIITNFTFDNGRKLKCPSVLYTTLNNFSTSVIVYSSRYADDKGTLIDDNFDDSFLGTLWWEPKLNSERSEINNVEISEQDDVENCTYYGLLNETVTVSAYLNKTKKKFNISPIVNGGVTFNFAEYNYSSDVTTCPDKVYVDCNLVTGECSRVEFKSFTSIRLHTFQLGLPPNDADDLEQEYNKINGNRYKELLGSLKTPLSSYASGALSIPLTIDGNENATLNDVSGNNSLCPNGDCSSNAQYYTEQGLKNIKNYCNELYSNYEKYRNEPDSLKKRMDECVSFNNFYSQLVNQGIVDNLANYCGFLSQEFAAKLKYFLSIIKVAGPLLALGLGTVDFVKVLANGDADKEMKNAFKRFLIRLGAAALLFLVPIILAFLLDLFMKPGLGYDSNNPFCDIVDWNG